MNWLSWTDGSNYEVVLITTHNSLLLYKLQGGMPSVSHYHSEVNCILYPLYLKTSVHYRSTHPLDSSKSYSACLIGSALDGLTVASGTVFNQILLWHVKGVTPGLHSNVLVRISFIGHQVSLQTSMHAVDPALPPSSSWEHQLCLLGGDIFSQAKR